MERRIYDGAQLKLRIEAFCSALEQLSPTDRVLIDGLRQRVQEAYKLHSSDNRGQRLKGFGETSALEVVGAVGMLLALDLPKNLPKR